MHKVTFLTSFSCSTCSSVFRSPNFSMKVLSMGNFAGSRKFSKLNNSSTLFCSGVPVSNTLNSYSEVIHCMADTYTHAHMYTHTYTCIQKQTQHTCTRIHIHTYTYTVTHTCTHTHSCTHTHPCMHAHSHTHTHTHGHAHTESHMIVPANYKFIDRQCNIEGFVLLLQG